MYTPEPNWTSIQRGHEKMSKPECDLRLGIYHCCDITNKLKPVGKQ